MNVKDLLLSCPIPELATEFIRQESISPEHFEKVTEICLYVIEQLKEKAPVDTGHILIGIFFQEDEVETLHPCLYQKEEWNAWKGEPEELAQSGNVQELSDDQVAELCCLTVPLETYAFDLSPWDEILGYELLEQNVADLGEAPLATAILLEMTLFGFTESDVTVIQGEILDSIKEAKRIMELPPEEQEKHLCSHEEFWKELDLPERHPEEIQQQRMQFRREIVENKLRKYRALKKYSSDEDAQERK